MRNVVIGIRVNLLWLLALLPMGSFAAPEWSTTTGTVSAVYSHNGFHVVQTSIADAPCGTAGAFWWPTGDSDAKDMFALALAAHLAGKRIRVVHDAAAPSCSNGGNLATYMLISD
jgi:hypothetical protein